MENVRYIVISRVTEELNSFTTDLCDFLTTTEIDGLARNITENLIQNNLIVKED